MAMYRFQPLLFQPVENVAPFSFTEVVEQERAATFPEIPQRVEVRIVAEGPLASLVSKAASNQLSVFHSWNFNLLLLLAAVHILAVLYHMVFMKENLIGAMFTGVKHLPADAAAGSASARFASPWFALVLFAVAAIAVYLIVKRPF